MEIAAPTRRNLTLEMAFLAKNLHLAIVATPPGNHRNFHWQVVREAARG
jgi:hypothetical protein